MLWGRRLPALAGRLILARPPRFLVLELRRAFADDIPEAMIAYPLI
jgi:hypothetical protein